MEKNLKLIELLSYLPTGDNAQPFRYALDHDSIQVFHYEKISKHKLNQSNVASLLTLGMIVYVIKNYAASEKMECELEYTKDFNKQDLWLTCRFKANQCASTSEDNLLDYLPKRRTDRGIYKKGGVDFVALKETFKDEIYFKESLSKNVFAMIAKFETMMFDDIKTFRDIEKWVRYSKDEVMSTRTGMSRQNLGLNFYDSRLFKLFSKDTFLNCILRTYFKFLMLMRINLFYKRSAGFGLCVLKDDSDASIIQMGGHILKAWLMLTKNGFSLQPISSPSLVSFIARNRKGDFFQEYVDESKKCCEVFNEEFHSKGEIIWFFRFGKAVKQPSHPTLRLPASELLKKT